MSQQKITKLTPEHETLIPVYQDKWRAIALSIAAIHQRNGVAHNSLSAAIGGVS